MRYASLPGSEAEAFQLPVFVLYQEKSWGGGEGAWRTRNTCRLLSGPAEVGAWAGHAAFRRQSYNRPHVPWLSCPSTHTTTGMHQCPIRAGRLLGAPRTPPHPVCGLWGAGAVSALFPTDARAWSGEGSTQCSAQCTCTGFSLMGLGWWSGARGCKSEGPGRNTTPASSELGDSGEVPDEPGVQP